MTNKRVVVTAFGGPEVLQVIEEELPEPGPGECRVRVLAAGVAYVDVMRRKGMYPGGVPPVPFSLGYDVVGEVDALGEDVNSLERGERVAALVKGGGNAEFLCLPAEKCVPVPAHLDPAEVVCLPLNYMTAYQMMHRFAKVGAGERVLIHGASGGVGTALLQLGRIVGLEMIGTASPGKLDLVEAHGAIAVDYRSEDFVQRVRALMPEGIDAVFDHIGGWHLWRSFRVLRRGGRLIAYGERAMIGDTQFHQGTKLGQDFLLKALKLVPNRYVTFYELDPASGMIPPEWFREDFEAMLKFLDQGQIKPIIHERIPLQEAARAHRLMEKAVVRGRIVLTNEG